VRQDPFARRLLHAFNPRPLLGLNRAAAGWPDAPTVNGSSERVRTDDRRLAHVVNVCAAAGPSWEPSSARPSDP